MRMANNRMFAVWLRYDSNPKPSLNFSTIAESIAHPGSIRLRCRLSIINDPDFACRLVETYVKGSLDVVFKSCSKAKIPVEKFSSGYLTNEETRVSCGQVWIPNRELYEKLPTLAKTCIVQSDSNRHTYSPFLLRNTLGSQILLYGYRFNFTIMFFEILLAWWAFRTAVQWAKEGLQVFSVVDDFKTLRSDPGEIIDPSAI